MKCEYVRDDGDEVWMVYIHLDDKITKWILAISYDDNVRIVVIVLLIQWDEMWICVFILES